MISSSVKKIRIARFATTSRSESQIAAECLLLRRNRGVPLPCKGPAGSSLRALLEDKEATIAQRQACKFGAYYVQHRAASFGTKHDGTSFGTKHDGTKHHGTSNLNELDCAELFSMVRTVNCCHRK